MSLMSGRKKHRMESSEQAAAAQIKISMILLEIKTFTSLFLFTVYFFILEIQLLNSVHLAQSLSLVTGERLM